MLRKCTALGFMLIMITIMMLKHPALAYCLCEHKVISITACTHQTDEQPACCQLCKKKNETKQPKPKNCTLQISFDAGNYFWQDPSVTPNPIAVPAISHTSPPLTQALTSSRIACLSLQNAPPPRPPIASLTGVYRL